MTEQRGSAPRSWFHGCWLEPGHHVFTVGGTLSKACPFADYLHGGLDGGYAPRRMTSRRVVTIPGEPSLGMDDLVFTRMVSGDDEIDHEIRRRIDRASAECPQGQFLYHENVRGCSLISWWDRTQGDTRGACNSTFIVDGVVPADSMVGLFKEKFPIQAQRLVDAGVELVRVNVYVRGRTYP